MIRIENFNSGEIVETDTSYWRNALNCIKSYTINTEIHNIKASDFINAIGNGGYSDNNIKGELIKGDWRNF